MSNQRSDSMVHDSSIVSYALYLITYSALDGKVLHLEDLFVRSEHRGKIIAFSINICNLFFLTGRGLGTVMMRECAQVYV